ncbi:AAA family ATPase [Rhizobium laguerreae]|uniref:Peptidase M41-like protein n=1 Tax=Rhizobium laguerreae TaxID=1076926 RepID=A0AAX2QSW9_9HYPH|nr:AAA family ATPase [Rhizobium laguerreae]TCU28183.1 peptidase M41-like protein [Rhizobium laguerreae]
MGRNMPGHRLDKFRKSPPIFLAYCGIRRALKKAAMLEMIGKGLVIFVTPAGYRQTDYCTAARYLFEGIPEFDWVENDSKIRTAGPTRQYGKAEEAVSVFDLAGLAVLIATDIHEVSLDVRFAAGAVLEIEAPSPGQIQGARRLSGKPPIADGTAALLATKPQNLLLASIARGTLDEEQLGLLDYSGSVSSQGPSLFELPGYDSLQSWAREIASDIDLCRRGKLAWKTVLSKGVLIHGPPGVGKTFAARALATAVGMKFVESTVGEWQAKGHLGDMLKAMRACFQAVGEGRGTVLFIDELDSIGSRSNFTDDSHGHYWQVVVNEFLTRLDKLPDGVLLVGATNFPSLIDSAVLRSGRIERKFALCLPDRETRAEILNWHTEAAIEFESLVEIADYLVGWSGADLEMLVRDARVRSRREDRDLELGDLLAKLPDRESFSPEDLFRLAVHEAGHALVALSLGYASSATITIKPTFDPNSAGRLGGITEYEYVASHIPTDTSLHNTIAVLLGGMAAEFLVFGDRSIGSGGVSGSDIERATTIARRLVYSYGLGHIPVFTDMNHRWKDSAINWRLEDNVFEILETQYERVLVMLESERDRVISLAKEAMLNLRVKIERDG